MIARGRKDQLQGAQGGRLFLAAALCGPIAGLVVMIVFGALGLILNASSGGPNDFPAQALLGAVVIGAVIGWPMMLVYGLPAHAFLYKRRSHRVSSYVLAGVLAGFLAAIVLSLLGLLFGFYALETDLALAGGIFALILLIASVTASSVFWLIRRPDRDVARADAVAAAFE